MALLNRLLSVVKLGGWCYRCQLEGLLKRFLHKLEEVSVLARHDSHSIWLVEAEHAIGSRLEVNTVLVLRANNDKLVKHGENKAVVAAPGELTATCLRLANPVELFSQVFKQDYATRRIGVAVHSKIVLARVEGKILDLAE
jgi:hypothetical protein